MAACQIPQLGHIVQDYGTFWCVVFGIVFWLTFSLAGFLQLIDMRREPGMFHASPRWAMSADGWSVLDRAAPASPAPTLHFYRRALASLAPNPSLLWTGSGQSGPQPLTFIERPWARPALLSRVPGQSGPQPLTFIERPWASCAPKPSLLLANPSSISQIYQLGHRPRHAEFCWAVSAPCWTVPCHSRPCHVHADTRTCLL